MTSRILFDTNVLIDYMIPARPGHDAAKRLFELSEWHSINVFVCAGSLKDAYYVTAKTLPERVSRGYIQDFIEAFDVLPFGEAECRTAAYSDEPDFEDGLVRAAAEINKVDFIITRDMKAFQHSTVRSMSAETYLELFDRPNGAV